MDMEIPHYETTRTEPLKPLAERMRPRRIEDVVGQEEVVAPGSPLMLMAQNPDLSSLAVPGAALLFGPPGTGKTTLSQLVAQESGRHMMKLNAVNLNVSDLTATLATISRLRRRNEECVLFIDEIHRLPQDMQDILLPVVEKRMMCFIAATTEPPASVLQPALLSRCIVVHLHKLTMDNLGEILDRACADPRGLNGRVRLDPEARKMLIVSSGGDARRSLTTLEAAASRAVWEGGDSGVVILTADDVRAVADNVARYSFQDQSNMTSAMIKSMRGSDADAAVYWAMRMLNAGEDPKFIARSVITTAAKDVGMADPEALRVATAAADAVDRLGMPNARFPLLEAVVYVSTAPKSDSIQRASEAVSRDIHDGYIGDVPDHLREPLDEEAKKEGEGNGYLNPHDFGGFVHQEYLPMGMEGHEYYQPNDSGMEHRIIPWLKDYRDYMAQKPSADEEREYEEYRHRAAAPASAPSADEAAAPDAPATDPAQAAPDAVTGPAA